MLDHMLAQSEQSQILESLLRAQGSPRVGMGPLVGETGSLTQQAVGSGGIQKLVLACWLLRLGQQEGAGLL